jgi:hypothetical protein
MREQTLVHDDTLAWLLEEDTPDVRYLALRDLVGLSPDDPELCAARRAAHLTGAIPTLLDPMNPEGSWVQPGPGYNPKYFSTVWSVILLAQLGASVEEDPRIAQACAYLLDHAFTASGQFSANGTPSGTADCLQGNLCWALVELGSQDPRLDAALEWMARTVTGEGLAPAGERRAPLRYYSGKIGPTFACGANDRQSCAWGAAKVMLALSRWPVERRTPLIQRAIDHGVDFLFSVDPALATYPSPWTGKPSLNWWKFGFPVFYITDLLQIVEVLVRLGCGRDPRLAHALELVRSKRTPDGRWLLEYDYHGKIWLDFGPKKQPNKWVTLRALRALKQAA